MFQRFLTQANKTKAVIFKVSYGMTQFLLQIADDQKPNTQVVADADNMAVDLGEEREFQHNDLRYAAFDDDSFEVVWSSKDRNAIVRFFDRLTTDETDCAQTDVGLTLQPPAQLSCFFSRSNQQGFLFSRSGKESSCQERRKITVQQE